MTELGIDISEFSRLQFSQEFLSEFDVIVAMAKEHQDYIQNEYKERIPLFNEILKGEETSVVIMGMDEEEIKAELRELVNYINSAIPRFLEVLTKGDFEPAWELSMLCAIFRLREGLRREGGRAAIG